MSACPTSSTCVFYTTIERSLIKRIKFASAFPYCKAGRHDECALIAYMNRGDAPPADLLPDGTHADYREDGEVAAAVRSGGASFLVVDDSPVFATLAANVLRDAYPGADVVTCHSFVEAEQHLADGHFRLIVSGQGLGDGHTVHDVRRRTMAPIVVFTGRDVEPEKRPANSQVVLKGAGPGALRQAADVLLGV